MRSGVDSSPHARVRELPRRDGALAEINQKFVSVHLSHQKENRFLTNLFQSFIETCKMSATALNRWVE